MTKKVSKKEKIFLSVLLEFAIFSVIFVLGVEIVSAADVAYIFKSKPKIDKNVLDVFSEMNLSVDLINEKKMPSSFAAYRFIYVGNERFSKNIPVNDFASVITNYYFGTKWGLTDRDGISKLAATHPLSVVKNDQIIQVYTQARYNNKPISLPYFYLGVENKVPAMEQIAGTYIGDNFDLGDVISFAKAGTHLINNKDAKGNICFFGIVESSYWTAEARGMFKECVNSVATTCSKDSDCPGNETGEKYCKGNDVYQDTIFHSCVNPGTAKSECIGNVIPKLIQECPDLCVNGECMGIVCRENSDCGEDGFKGELFCQGNNVYGNFVTYTCNAPGTENSSCTNSSETRLKEECSVFCVNGECKPGNHDIGFIDFTDSVDKIRLESKNGTRIMENPALLMCNQEYKIWVDVKNNGDFYENVTFNGNIDGLLFNHNPKDNLAPGDDSQKYKTINLTLPSGSYNITVNAIIPVDNNPLNNIAKRQINVACPECNTDNDCPADNFSDNFCLGKDVFRDFNDFSCINNSCVKNTSKVFVKECPDLCINGECIGVVCRNDSKCGTDGFAGTKFCFNNNSYDYFITYTCNAPGTQDSYCTNKTTPVLLKYCDLTCVNGECIACFNNLSCGKDGFIGDKYCQGNDVYRDFKQFSCENPGTPLSVCSSAIFPKLIEKCSGLCVNGECKEIICRNDSDCDDENVSTFDECVRPGTPQSFCRHTPVNCISNAECGITGFLGQEFCFAGDVFKNFQTSLCINPGTISSYCDISIAPKLLKDCGSGICSNGICINIACFNDLQCNDDNQHTKDICINPGTISSHCEHNTIICLNNSECGIDEFTGNPFCQNNSVFQNFIAYTCNNPGATNSFCTNTTTNKLKTDCLENQICLNGECINIKCTKNSDCGQDGFSGAGFCKSDDVFKNFVTHTCNNPGAPDSHCSNSTIQKLFTDCGEDSCGEFGVNFCKNNDVYKSRTCSDKGCSSGNCFNNNFLEETLVQDCDGGCSNGQCINITCRNNSDCNDDDIYTIDQCNNPGTAQSYCTHITVNCINNNDCGITGFLGEEFCFANDVFKNFQNSTCVNPGTSQSYCDVSKTPKLINDCGEDFCGSFGDNFCKDNKVFHSRICMSRGCSANSCFANLIQDEKLVKECDENETCSNGECTPIDIPCTFNSDCGTNGFISGLFCQDNDVYKDFITFACNNPGTPNSFCSNSTNSRIIEDCNDATETCSNGECTPIDIPCTFNVDCGTDRFTGEKFCQDSDVYRNFTTFKCNNPGNQNSFCSNATNPRIIEDCDDATETCSNGQCKPIDIPCTFNIDCGVNRFIGDKFCQNNDVFQNFLTFKCNNPGTSNSFCTNTTTQKIRNDCDDKTEICSNEQCVPVNCFSDSDCGTDRFTGNPFCQNNGIFQNFINFTCINPGTIESTCEVTSTSIIKKECLANQVCLNRECINITCNSNSDCGTDRFLNQLFCKDNDVFDKFLSFKCNNPGSDSSSCSNSTEERLIEKCSFTCSNGKCENVTECINSVPFYRAYNVKSSDHFYTTTKSEIDNAIANLGYLDETIAANIFDRQVPGSVPLYRLFNIKVSDHFYTTDINERNNALSNLGYINEEIAGYVYPSQAEGTIPFYRGYNAKSPDHFYTIKRSEMDNAVNVLGYADEGIAGYVFQHYQEITGSSGCNQNQICVNGICIDK